MNVSRRALLAAGLLGGAVSSTAYAATSTTVRVQHSSMQFSDDRAQHRHDAEAVFAHARHVGNVLLSGTESGHHNSLWSAVPAAAARHGFAVFHHPFGEWVAVDRRFGTIANRGVVPVYGGLSGGAAHGGHAPRGIVWIRVDPHQRRLGPIVFGVSHWLTHRSLRASGLRDNRRMIEAVDRWANVHGAGPRLVFYAADTNVNDRRASPLRGGPLTTCWDEIRRWPNTRKGSTIDVIASRDHDDRVSCRGARVLDDRDLYLATDHSLIEAAYRVDLRRA